MILPQHQSISGGGAEAPPHRQGDCWRASMATALCVPIPALPHFAAWSLEDKDWWPAVQKWLHEHYGIELCLFEPAEAGWTQRAWGLAGIWLAAVPSLNLPPDPNDGKEQLHSVVMEGDRLAFDPSTKKRREKVRLADVRVAEFFRLTEPARAA